MKNFLIKLILLSVLVSISSTGFVDESPLPTSSSNSKPARKPPRFGKRSFYVILSPNLMNNREFAKNSIHNSERITSNALLYDLPAIDNYKRVFLNWLLLNNDISDSIHNRNQ
jgi:hypothetical protein